VPGNNAPWQEVRDTLNRSLRGWSNYFCYGTRRSAFRSVDREELGFPEPSMKVYGLAVARPVLVRFWKRQIELIEHPGAHNCRDAGGLTATRRLAAILAADVAGYSRCARLDGASSEVSGLTDCSH